VSGFDSGFEKLWEVFPKKSRMMAAWEEWCKLQSQGVLPPVTELICAVKAELEANGGKYLPGLEQWLRGRRWLDTPSVEGEARKPVIYRDKWGKSTSQPKEAAICNCGAKVICDHGTMHDHPQRHCPACGRNYPCGGSACDRRDMEKR
jgi:hypothetical protein